MQSPPVSESPRETQDFAAPPGPHHFDAEYREAVTLADDTSVVLRALRADDAPLLAEGFRRLSEESRYMRFFAARSSLSAKDLEYFTHIDGENHFALVAVLSREGKEELVGVARFVRLPNEPDVAEPAITVIDRLQGRGLGRILLDRLIAAARERSVDEFRFEILSGNARMRSLLHDVAPHTNEHDDGTTIRVVVPLDAGVAGTARRHSVLHRVLTLAARGLFR